MTITIAYGFPKPRTFECKVEPGFPGKVEVTISEVVRPSWKFFHTKSCANICFNIDEYDTIYDGVCDVVKLYYQKTRVELERQEKWREFKENTKKS